jgi:hypothetical protein
MANPRRIETPCPWRVRGGLRGLRRRPRPQPAHGRRAESGGAPFASHLGDEGAPFVWDEEPRFLMRAELDAAYFHLYGVSEDEAALVLDSFRAFRNRKQELFHRTKDEILAIYREMAKAAEQGTRYVHAELSPAPAGGRRHGPGTSPLTRSAPPAPEPPDSGGQSVSDPGRPDAEDGVLFGMADIGVHEQLGFWN